MHRKPFLALGSPGGSTIITTVLQMIVNRIDLGMDVEQAIADDAAPVKERIDAAQKRIMALSDTATLGAREPQLVADLMPKYLAAVGERWERKGGGISTGFPDLDRRLGGLSEGNAWSGP